MAFWLARAGYFDVLLPLAEVLEEVDYDPLNECDGCPEGDTRHGLLKLELNIGGVLEGSKDEKGVQAEDDDVSDEHDDVQPQDLLITLQKRIVFQCTHNPAQSISQDNG